MTTETGMCVCVYVFNHVDISMYMHVCASQHVFAIRYKMWELFWTHVI